MAFITLTVCCCSERLCILDKKNGTTYLTGVRLNESLSTDTIKNGGFCLSYSTEHRHKGFRNFIIGSNTKESYSLNVIPENGRFRFETMLTSSSVYERGKEVIHAFPLIEWEFTGYSDDDNCIDTKVWKYFLKHGNSK